MIYGLSQWDNSYKDLLPSGYILYMACIETDKGRLYNTLTLQSQLTMVKNH